MDVVTNILTLAGYEGLVFGIVAIGIHLTFRTLSFPDLSVDGTFPLGGAIAAVLISQGANPFLATFIALIGGMGAGLITGLLNTKLRISALLSGILVMVGLYSVNLRIMGGANIPLLRDITTFDIMARIMPGASKLVVAIVLVSIVVILLLVFLSWFLRTEIGLALRATGDNEEMVRGFGVDTDKTVLIGCAISNGLVALAGALVAQNQGFSDVGMGIGMIVLGLASVIIGEGLFRSKGITIVLIAAIGGAFVYRLFIAIVLRLGAAPGDLKLITAVLVIIVLTMPFIRKKLRGDWLPPAKRW